MRFVLDCPVAMAWCFEDEISPYTEAALDILSKGNALVPSIWSLEGNQCVAGSRAEEAFV